MNIVQKSKCLYKTLVLFHITLTALLQSANFTVDPDATLNTEMHKYLVYTMAPNSVDTS